MSTDDDDDAQPPSNKKPRLENTVQLQQGESEWRSLVGTGTLAETHATTLTTRAAVAAAYSRRMGYLSEGLMNLQSSPLISDNGHTLPLMISSHREQQIPAPRPANVALNSSQSQILPRQQGQQQQHAHHPPPRGSSSGLRNPSFPEKLMCLLNSEHAQYAICWMPNGNAFAIDPRIFSNTILLTHFDHTKFDSFKRKLNRWGFKRLMQDEPSDGIVIYHHRLFRRDFPDLCRGMSGGKREERDLTDGLVPPPQQQRQALDRGVAGQHSRPLGLAAGMMAPGMAVDGGCALQMIQGSIVPSQAVAGSIPSEAQLALFWQGYQQSSASSAYLDWIRHQEQQQQLTDVTPRHERASGIIGRVMEGEHSRPLNLAATRGGRMMKAEIVATDYGSPMMGVQSHFPSAATAESIPGSQMQLELLRRQYQHAPPEPSHLDLARHREQQQLVALIQASRKSEDYHGEKTKPEMFARQRGHHWSTRSSLGSSDVVSLGPSHRTGRHPLPHNVNFSELDGSVNMELQRLSSVHPGARGDQHPLSMLGAREAAGGLVGRSLAPAQAAPIAAVSRIPNVGRLLDDNWASFSHLPRNSSLSAPLLAPRGDTTGYGRQPAPEERARLPDERVRRVQGHNGGPHSQLDGERPR